MRLSRQRERRRLGKKEGCWDAERRPSLATETTTPVTVGDQEVAADVRIGGVS